MYNISLSYLWILIQWYKKSMKSENTVGIWPLDTCLFNMQYNDTYCMQNDSAFDIELPTLLPI